MKENIIIKGAREHNLKNIDVEIPRNKLTVITGLSGSVETGIAISKGSLIVLAGRDELVFSSSLSCPDCGVSYSEISP
ncbi:MAG: hypothetical protein AB1630_00160 [bacterium]